MVTCANITLEKIRAEISFGSLEFETPDIKSFSVSRSRSSISAQFSASIEVPASTIFPINQEIVIRAGTEGNLQTIFTGRVLTITVNPSFDKATTYIVNMSGQDKMQELEGQTFSRRQRTRGASSFAAITGISGRRPTRGISYEKRSQSGGSTEIQMPEPNLREHSRVVRTDRVNWDPFNPAKDPENLENRDPSASQDIIDIKPRNVSLSPGVSVVYNIENATYSEGDSWSVTDTTIGTIVDRQDGTAVYTQRALGENTIIFTQAGSDETTTFTGKATAVGIPIHDHSSLGEGGPAFGVYSSD